MAEQIPLFPNQPKTKRQPTFSHPQPPFQQPQPPFQMPGLASTGRGKLVATLGIIALVLGVVAEIIAIGTGYHNMNTAESEAKIKGMDAYLKECSPLFPTPRCKQRWDQLDR